MKSIVEERLVSFKELEKKIFAYVCELGREITRIILEDYDKELMEGRDKMRYRNKGHKETAIKTVYGEVTYSRRIYQTILETGEKAFVFLLDDAMQMEKIGLISSNLAEKLAMTITEAPYRETAKMISTTCGQSISHGGVWNFVQKLGERIKEEEEADVGRMNHGDSRGRREIPVLFEEMDGVWLRMQKHDHKKAPKQEMKVFTMYEGWDAEAEKMGRSVLKGKSMLAGMEKSAEFHEKREAFIQAHYDADEIKQRILNGDGGSWIKEDYDPEAIFQLDRFHIYKEIRRLIKDPKAQADIRNLLEEEKPEEMLSYIETYATSVASPDPADHQSRDALALYQYLANNKDGLLPYHKRGIGIPKPQEGIIYKDMGVQENQNCTLITMRMKHRRMRWGSGANNLAKVMYRKENHELIETIDRYSDGLVINARLNEIVEALSAAKAPRTDGKGSPYPDLIRGHVPLLEAMRTASRRAFMQAFAN